jgi:hypothetical protein
MEMEMEHQLNTWGDGGQRGILPCNWPYIRPQTRGREKTCKGK